MSNKKKGTTKKDTSTEEVTDGIQKLVKATAQEPIVLDQEEDEPQGSDADNVDVGESIREKIAEFGKEQSDKFQEMTEKSEAVDDHDLGEEGEGEEEAAPEPEIEVLEGEIVEEKVEDPTALARLSEPPFEQRSQANQIEQRPAQQPNAVVEKLKKTIWDKHGNRGQLAVEFAKAILSAQGLKSNTEQIVKRSFEITDGIQAEIDRGYNEEMTRMITGNQ